MQSLMDFVNIKTSVAAWAGFPFKLQLIHVIKSVGVSHVFNIQRFSSNIYLHIHNRGGSPSKIISVLYNPEHLCFF